VQSLLVYAHNLNFVPELDAMEDWDSIKDLNQTDMLTSPTTASESLDDLFELSQEAFPLDFAEFSFLSSSDTNQSADNYYYMYPALYLPSDTYPSFNDHLPLENDNTSLCQDQSLLYVIYANVFSLAQPTWRGTM